MPFPQKFSDEQRAVIAYAVLDDAHSVSQAVEAASLGKLGPAFAMSQSVAYKIVSTERDRRRPVTERAHDLARRTLGLCERDISRLEGVPEPLGSQDARALRNLVEAAHIAHEILEPSRSAEPSDADDEDDVEA